MGGRSRRWKQARGQYSKQSLNFSQLIAVWICFSYFILSFQWLSLSLVTSLLFISSPLVGEAFIAYAAVAVARSRTSDCLHIPL